jgi:hypothetical protein
MLPFHRPRRIADRGASSSSQAVGSSYAHPGSPDRRVWFCYRVLPNTLLPLHREGGRVGAPVIAGSGARSGRGPRRATGTKTSGSTNSHHVAGGPVDPARLAGRVHLAGRDQAELPRDRALTSAVREVLARDVRTPANLPRGVDVCGQRLDRADRTVIRLEQQACRFGDAERYAALGRRGYGRKLFRLFTSSR